MLPAYPSSERPERLERLSELEFRPDRSLLRIDELRSEEYLSPYDEERDEAIPSREEEEVR